jgi:peptide/nickel transport system substrate-binding protein
MTKTRKLSKLAVLGTVIAAAAIVLSACGSSSSPTTTTSPSSTGTHMVPIKGGTLTIAEAAAGGPNYIFPMMGGAYFSVANFQLVYLLYRPLYWFGLGNTPDLNTGLSVAYPPVYSNGARTVTIRLKGYKWSDGETVDAQDVMFWLNMLKANATSWAAYAPGPGQYPGDISNAVPDAKTDTVTLTLDATYSSYWFTYNELSQISPLPMAWDITSPGAKPASGGCSSASYASVTTKTTSSGALVPVSASAKDCAAVYTFLTSKTEAGDLGTYATNPLWSVVDGPFKLTAYDATDNGATVVPNPHYSGPVKSSLTALKMAPFTNDSSEYLELQAGNTINIGYIPPQDLPRYTGAAFSKNGAPLAGKNAASIASRYNLDPVYPWGVNYFALNYTNPVSGPIFKQLYIRQAMQSLMNQSLWIQLYNAGYGAPTYGPVPVYPPTNLVTRQESNNPYPYSPSHAIALLKSHGWKVVPDGVTTCVKPGTGSNECGAGIAKNAALNFNYLYYNGATSFSKQIQELATSWEQAGIKVNLSGKAFGDVLTVAATPCTPGKSCNWDITNWGGGWVYSPDMYPTGEEIFATGASQNFGLYSNATNDQLIKLTNTSSSLSALYNYENYLAKQIPDIWQPETALEFNEVGKNICGFTPQNPLFSWEAEYWHFCKAEK